MSENPLTPVTNKELFFKSILIIEDDARLSRSLCSAVQDFSEQTHTCSSIEQAKAMLSDCQPEVILLDFKLPDGDAFKLLAEIRHCSPFPAVIAISAYAQPQQTFELAKLGVRAYLQKPIDLADLEKALELVAVCKPDLTPYIRNSVGTVGLKQMETELRQTMLAEALSRSNGSRRGAAKLLRVSRQFVQHVLNKFKINEKTNSS